jgi:bifunctional UDP-N-acetylglucosamine pyrophosphorylase/glucosamine-1-phosphate N-acetyltransferase
MGRVLRDDSGKLLGVREAKDCDEDQLWIEEFNVGTYCFDGERLPAVLAKLSSDNAQGELYLTDTVAELLADDELVETLTLVDTDEALGVNTLEELALARQVIQERILVAHLENGVIIEDPGTTFIDHGVAIGAGTRILPCTVIRSGVVIGADCEVGPFSHLRVGTYMEEGAEVGNFVEVKKSFIGSHTKAKHLTYLGDTTIGQRSNIGAGTITANYDGKAKHPTVIGDGAFVGSGTVLVAPAKMGDGATTGAGAIVTRNTQIPPGDVYVGVPAKSLKDRKGENPEEANAEQANAEQANEESARSEE